MGLDLDYTAGQTPLEEEEKEGLLIPTIGTRSELDEFEQQNIEQAMQWTIAHSFKLQTVFSESFVRMVHKRMFSEVWSWAGELRKTNKNIGTDKWQIATELKYLLDDAKFWNEKNIFHADELAVRFKHRLVSIHCFPNGNGRHSRLMADIIIEKIYKQPVFTWGSGGGYSNADARNTYLRAVKTADKGDYSLLLAFARS
jgi:Fic-DOC domain mobile mystery protein B